jgi:hypothetical protein
MEDRPRRAFLDGEGFIHKPWTLLRIVGLFHALACSIWSKDGSPEAGYP